MEERDGEPSIDSHPNHANIPNYTSIPNTNQTALAINHQITPQPSPPSPNPDPLYGAGTYVVQVPKDQIFHVPPPKNDRHLQRSQAGQGEGSSRRCCGCCSSCMCVIVCVIVIVLILGVVFGVVLAHDDPGFHIEHLGFERSPPEFHVGLQVQNPNKHNGISYENRDPDVTLLFKQKEIANGKFPIFYQDPGNTTILGFDLHGFMLPGEIATSTNGTKSKIEIPLTLSMNIVVQFKLAGLNVKSKIIDVSCSFKVDRLDRDTHILAQDCVTN